MSIAIGNNTQAPQGVDAAPAPAKAAPFRFAPTFIVDLCFSAVYAFSFGRVIQGVDRPVVATLIGLPIVALIMLCYLGKILVIRFLERRGGNARTYVLSNAMVTDGPYAWSRNPTYLLALIQFLLWSVLLLVLQAFGSFEWLPMIVACFGPLLFFNITDRVNIAREDRELAAKHPEEFAAYSRKVGRWIGRLS